jgi:hypothetical protein
MFILLGVRGAKACGFAIENVCLVSRNYEVQSMNYEVAEGRFFWSGVGGSKTSAE